MNLILNTYDKSGFNCRNVQEDLSKELDLQINGAEKPSLWGLVGVGFVLLPYTLSKVKYMLNLSNLMEFREK